MAIELSIWWKVGAVALVGTAATYMTGSDERAIMFGIGSLVLWGWFSIGALDVHKPVGVCCTYSYSYPGIAFLSLIPGGMALLRAVDSILQAMEQPTLSSRLFGWSS